VMLLLSPQPLLFALSPCDNCLLINNYTAPICHSGILTKEHNLEADIAAVPHPSIVGAHCFGSWFWTN